MKVKRSFQPIFISFLFIKCFFSPIIFSKVLIEFLKSFYKPNSFCFEDILVLVYCKVCSQIALNNRCLSPDKIKANFRASFPSCGSSSVRGAEFALFFHFWDISRWIGWPVADLCGETHRRLTVFVFLRLRWSCSEPVCRSLPAPLIQYWHRSQREKIVRPPQSVRLQNGSEEDCPGPEVARTQLGHEENNYRLLHSPNLLSAEAGKQPREVRRRRRRGKEEGRGSMSLLGKSLQC